MFLLASTAYMLMICLCIPLQGIHKYGCRCTQYCQRLCGNDISYQTTIKQLEILHRENISESFIWNLKWCERQCRRGYTQCLTQMYSHVKK